MNSASEFTLPMGLNEREKELFLNCGKVTNPLVLAYKSSVVHFLRCCFSYVNELVSKPVLVEQSLLHEVIVFAPFMVAYIFSNSLTTREELSSLRCDQLSFRYSCGILGRIWNIPQSMRRFSHPERLYEIILLGLKELRVQDLRRFGLEVLHTANLKKTFVYTDTRKIIMQHYCRNQLAVINHGYIDKFERFISESVSSSFPFDAAARIGFTIIDESNVQRSIGYIIERLSNDYELQELVFDTLGKHALTNRIDILNCEYDSVLNERPASLSRLLGS